MRKFIAGIMMLVMPLMAMATPTPVEIVDTQYLWQIGTDPITEANSIAVTVCDDVNVGLIRAASVSSITIPASWGGMEFRFRILDGNNNDASQLEMYMKSNNQTNITEHWSHEVTLVITQGTQEYTGAYYFADTVADTNNIRYSSEAVSQTNSIAKFAMQIFGEKEIKFVAPDLNDSDKIYFDYRRWSR